MKTYFLISLLSVVSSFASASEVVKTCSFTIQLPGDSRLAPTTYQIVKNDGSVIAKGIQTINGQPVFLEDETATINEYSVRSQLTSESPNMNEAEKLISSTAEELADPGMESFSVGLDLKSIRHAKVYQIGQFTHMGGMVIIEAQDEHGKDLGSFVTGFLPFACKP